MVNMEGSVRSGGVLKKKSSAGCLIIKKKVEHRNSGGWEGLSSSTKEKKRPRLVAGDLDVSNEDQSLDFMRKKLNDKRLHNGFMGYRRNEIENRGYHRNSVGIAIIGGRERSKLESFECEYDEFDEEMMRDEYVKDRFMMVGCGGENLRKFGVGASHRNLLVDKRQNSYSDDSSIGRGRGVEHAGLRNKGFELEENEVDMPISLLSLKYQEMADESIRLQGKNGVLKVMVNKKKRMDLHSHHKKCDPREVEERAGSWSEDFPKDLAPRLTIDPASRPPETQGLLAEKEKNFKKRKTEVKMEKLMPKLSKGMKARESETSDTSKCIKVREPETDTTDTALKLALPGFQASSSKKEMKKEGERAPPENVTPIKGKEGKTRCGGSTEKQMLREKIREMLVDAGWTIDYRPRRNRDYLDAVYISPNGTAYWSIIKAYDALKKQLEEDNSKSKMIVDSPSFTPLSEDLINKLTRQTKKKIEEEMKRKRKEDGRTKSAKNSAVRDAGESPDSGQIEERHSSYMKQSSKSRRGKLPEVDEDGDGDLSDYSPKRKYKKTKAGKRPTASNSNVLQGRTSKVIGRCTLLVRSSDKRETSEFDGYVPYNGKRTVLSWLIDSGTARLSEKVLYMNRRRARVMLEGWITRDGIHCSCCSKILTVSKFELHAGSKLRQPFQNIFLESGASLLQCQTDAWNRQGESACQDFHTVDDDGDDPDDDTCGICGDGGALICCDSCPSTFHQICLEMQMLPTGDWHCPNCICKYCGDASENTAEENDNTAVELTRCSFCEKKYHKSCSDGMLAPHVSSNGASFCGLECQEFYDSLQKILGVKHELEAGFSWSLIQRTDVSDTSHRGFPQRVESNSKLAVVLSVMDECFLPIIDRRSGINMIRNVVYNIGSNFNRLNYHAFYTAILERSDEIVSAASIRIHGTRLVEMPFIGTREIYRRQGMCRRLLSAIETELCSLKVEQLIIPAISEHMNTWTTVFGFHQLEDVLKKEIKSMNMLVFPGTDMLQKELVKHSDGMKVSKSVNNQSRLPVLVEKPDIDSSMGHNKQMTNDSAAGYDTKNNGKVNGVASGFSALAVPSNVNSAASAADSVCEPNIPLASNGTSVVKSAVENKQKELCVSTNCPHIPDEYHNISDMKNRLLDPPLRDHVSSVEAVLGITCKVKVSCLKSVCDSSVGAQIVAEANGNQIHLAKDSAEFTNSGPIGSVSSSVIERSSYGATGKVNGEYIASSPTRVTIEEEPTITPVENESSADSATASYPKIGVEAKDIKDDKSLCTEKNIDASLDFYGENVVERMNENHNPCPIYTSDAGDIIASSSRKLDWVATLPTQNDLDVSGLVSPEATSPAGNDIPDVERAMPRGQ